MTPAELCLWQLLRRGQLGAHFRRQQLIAGFITDFYCERTKLAVEVDGGVHNDPSRQMADAERTQAFNEKGVEVIRFTNKEVLEEPDKVLQQIRATLGRAGS